jgi:hypothetical protein
MLSGYKTSRNRLFNYKICGFHHALISPSGGHTKLYRPPKHFLYWKFFVLFKVFTNRVVWPSVVLQGQEKWNMFWSCLWHQKLLFTFPWLSAPNRCQTFECKQDNRLLEVMSAFVSMHRLPTQCNFCEHGQLQKTCHLQLKSAHDP